MRKIIYFIFIFLLLSTSAYAFEWRTVGGDPYQGNARQAISKMNIPDAVKGAAIYKFERGPATTEIVPNHKHFEQMIYGYGRLESNVTCNWQNYNDLQSETIQIGNIKIYHFFACNNWTWEYTQTITSIPPPPPEFGIPVVELSEGPGFNELTDAGGNGATVTWQMFNPNPAPPIPTIIGDTNISGISNAMGGNAWQMQGQGQQQNMDFWFWYYNNIINVNQNQNIDNNTSVNNNVR